MEGRQGRGRQRTYIITTNRIIAAELSTSGPGGRLRAYSSADSAVATAPIVIADPSSSSNAATIPLHVQADMALHHLSIGEHASIAEHLLLTEQLPLGATSRPSVTSGNRTFRGGVRSAAAYPLRADFDKSYAAAPTP